MPTFKAIVKESVIVNIEYDIEADTQEEAAILALRNWVVHGEGEAQEHVNERWVEVNGEVIEGVSEDDETPAELALQALAEAADKLGPD